MRRHRHRRTTLWWHRCRRRRRRRSIRSLSSTIVLLRDHFEIRNRRTLNGVVRPSGSTARENNVLERQVLAGDDFLDLAMEDGIRRLLESDLDGHAGEVGHGE